MGTSKTTLEELELSTGVTIYVQISNSGRASLSIDSSEINTAVWLTREELNALSHLIIKANGEWEDK